ncbi:mannose-1-phosphate guanylyltransferase [Clostridium cylindrosporum]|uniref:mannose-1-phosphate guanylyltransferase n=1 Tax=Clostridium cylindrosporum DSM 605 TaxID=1121307 RepID=A0A0J8G5B0_CLOCY|nr:mannose-1-phosphate guanylyltransferase [Clostridium cylindrosporum]KMT22846.1 alginate biosynthesis protein AlgA [Clostridium cylindrosporum DSM 605]
MVYGVIMSGGLGSRFWPKSRKHLPKQFLKTVGDKTMIECTIDRISSVIDKDKIHIVTNQNYVPIIKNLLDIEDGNIFREPTNKETASCIGLAAIKLLKKDFEAVMVVLPSDHVIIGQDQFEETLRRGISMARDGDYLVTMGISPTRPEAGYGYIEKGAEVNNGIYKVKRFVEKPNVEVAKSFIEKGSYLWNSGMFIWRADRLLREFKKYLPDLYKSLMRMYEYIGTDRENEVIEEEYNKIDGISIDFGIMQRTHRGAVLETSFEWDDIGSFTSLERFLDKDEYENVISVKDVSLLDVKNTTILGDKRLVAGIGLENILIVDTEDVLLVCNKERCQDIKALVKNISSLDEYEKFI